MPTRCEPIRSRRETGNLCLAPIGALLLCYGASGLIAQRHFGARTGWAPALLGAILLAFGLLYADHAAALLMLVPSGALGALLLLAGTDLALSRRLLEARPDCRPAVATAAVATLLLNSAASLVAGWIAEVARSMLVAFRQQAWRRDTQ